MWEEDKRLQRALEEGAYEHLISENVRLTAENAALREIGQAMADYTCSHSDHSGYYFCEFCGVERREELPYYAGHPDEEQGMREWITHKPDCPVAKARALLSGSRANEQEAQ